MSETPARRTGWRQRPLALVVVVVLVLAGGTGWRLATHRSSQVYDGSTNGMVWPPMALSSTCQRCARAPSLTRLS